MLRLAVYLNSTPLFMTKAKPLRRKVKSMPFPQVIVFFLMLSLFLASDFALGSDGKPASADSKVAPNAPQALATPGMLWDMKALADPPTTYTAPDFAAEGVKALFYKGEPWKGKETRVFAWVGMPAHAPGQKVPGMVLVHGGGGTAFDEWVRIWTAKGYAAIAMDWNGTVPKGEHPNRPRHEWAGPPSATGGFDQFDWAQKDTWNYHAVADVILANSLLRSMPDVDPNRIGLTGISWGGYLTCIVSGVDNRFKFGIPVYGCGFWHEDSFFSDIISTLPADKKAKWVNWWDPSAYLGHTTMPMLWVTGTNDPFLYMDIHKKSYLLTKGGHTLAIRVRMGHDHQQGWTPKEIYAFADSHFKGDTPLAICGPQGRDGEKVWTTYTCPVNQKSIPGRLSSPVVSAQLNYTTDSGPWKDRNWKTTDAQVDTAASRVAAALPKGATTWYFNLTDDRGYLVSTEYLEAK